MSKPIVDALIDLCAKGRLDSARQLLLHSSSWQQHGFTAYGVDQINDLWLRTFVGLGACDVVEQSYIQNAKQHALYLLLKHTTTGQCIRLALTFEANDTHIKRLNCVFASSDISTADIDQLPSPDPLVVSQLDQQLHPQSFHAVPSDLVKFQAADNPLSALLDQWWAIWHKQSFDNLERLYAKDAVINVFSYEHEQGVSALKDFCVRSQRELTRNYMQLKQVLCDETLGEAAIEWTIDADVIHLGQHQRIRIPVVSFLTIDLSKKAASITNERLLVDVYALYKRYGFCPSSFA